MRKDKVIYLISHAESHNSIKDPIKTPSKRMTFAQEKSVRQSEHYQAASVGLKPEIVLVAWSLEYRGEDELEYNGVIYNIVRTYAPNDKDIELVCSRAVNRSRRA